MSIDWDDWQPFDGAPGRPLAEVDRATAQRYFDELMSARRERKAQLEALLERNSVQIGTDDVGLQALDDWYQANVSGSLERLDDRWYAVGLDIALYLGDAIIDRAPGVEWRLFTQGRRDVSYQRPVLMGFSRVENSRYNIDPESLVGIHGHRIVAGEVEPRDYFVRLVEAAAAKA